MVEVVVAGGINWDINLFVQRFARPGEQTAVIRISRGPGGKAGNTSVAAARLLRPNSVAMIGVLGSDDIAETQLRMLKDEGIETSGINRSPNAESGQAYIVTDESGENIIHTYFGANAILSSKLVLNNAAKEMLRSSRMIVIADPPQETIQAIVEIAQETGCLIAWDPGIRAQAGMKVLRSILLHVTYLFLNQAEVKYMTGTSEPKEATERLFETNPEITVILKSGGRGCTMVRRELQVRFPGIELSKCGLKVVNTVGCGDAFLGAFSAAKTFGFTDEKALGWANWAGALKATKPETRGSPTRNELDKWATKTETL